MRSQLEGPQLVFIISMPRSGSTLLQRLLMTHSVVAAVPEPWFLLPLVYSTRATGITAEYGHSTASRATQSLIQRLPNGENDWVRAVAGLARSIYAELSHGSQVFVDKTPRYYLIIPDLVTLFPDAKFIILTRNPLSIFTSCLSAFRAGSLRRFDHVDRDLHLAPALIAKGVDEIGESGLVVRYEDLVRRPEGAMTAIFDFLELEYEDVLGEFNEQPVEYGLGDYIGAAKYSGISAASCDAWRNALDSPMRRLRAARYVQSLDRDYLDLAGYDARTLKLEIRGTKWRRARPLEFAYLVEEIVVRCAKKIFHRETLS